MKRTSSVDPQFPQTGPHRKRFHRGALVSSSFPHSHRRGVRRGLQSPELLESRKLLTSVVYDDQLQLPWQDWSWGTSVDLANNAPVSEGVASIAVGHNEAWSGFYLGAPTSVDLAAGDELRFRVHGGNGGQAIRFHVVDASGTWHALADVEPTPNRWTEVTADFPDWGTPTAISGIVWQENAGVSNAANYFIDQVEIGDFLPEEVADPLAGPSITITPNVSNGLISDGVYGLNFADTTFAAEIDLPINRWGGNSTTRYNFELDATNLASDWYFENYPAETPDITTLPAGSTADLFVEAGQQAGADSIMTVGMLGWTPNSRDIRGSFPVDIYGAQQSVDPWHPNNGNGIRPDGSFITDNDPSITSIPVGPEFARRWVDHLVSQHGTAAEGGVSYYALDNEPMLWNSTHRDVHPEPASFEEVFNKGRDYASVIKQSDPTAKTLGPASWGWTAYFYSALDAAAGGDWWNNPLDRNAHGGQAFLPWYLSQMANAESLSGQRLLDYLDIHFYPQASGVALSPAGDLATQQLRLRSTRALWDPDYVDESWINEPVQLIPRMRDWIDTYYPGTKLALTEYNWGATDHISGALAQADVLGILGREGVDIATLWAPPAPDDPAAFAFRMFRNYDGQGTSEGKFGDTSLGAVSADSDVVSAFAARRSADDALTIVLINKSTSPRVTPLAISDLPAQALAERYVYDATQPDQIVQVGDVAFRDGVAEITLPPYSLTTLELRASQGSLGDFNRDGIVDGIDLDLLCRAASSGSTQLVFDINGDGSVNADDVDRMVTVVLETLPGDANLDLVVDVSDFNLWNAHRFATGLSWSAGDFSCDGAIDVSDFNIWNAHKFTSASRPLPAASPAASSFPEGMRPAIDRLYAKQEAAPQNELRATSSVARDLAILRNVPLHRAPEQAASAPLEQEDIARPPAAVDRLQSLTWMSPY